MAAIAFIGLGQMGSPMASNLLQQGHQLRVFDVNAEAVRHLVDKGATPAFMIDLAHKDLGIALDVANQLHVPMPLGAASREVYSQARAAGRGRQDWSAILEQVRVSAGMTAKVKM
ncbi:NAD-binding protein [Escherichia coli]